MHRYIHTGTYTQREIISNWEKIARKIIFTCFYNIELKDVKKDQEENMI